MAHGTNDPMTEAAYQKALDAVDAVLNDADANPDQVAAAEASLREITQAYTDFVEDRITARTEVLDQLTAQLQTVIDAIAINPIGDALDKLNEAVTVANEARGSNA
jgi:hypothetical protein